MDRSFVRQTSHADGWLGMFAVVIWITFFSVAGRAYADSILSFDSTVQLSGEDVLTVSEVLEVKVTGEGAVVHGIFRDIPVVMKGEGKALLRPELVVLDVLRDGRKEKFSERSSGGFRRIRIGDTEEELPPGVYRYELVYSMSRVVRRFGDHDELYWNVTGNFWELPIESASAVVVLPGGLEVASIDGFCGKVGSKERAAVLGRTTGNQAEFKMGRGLLPGEGMSVVVSFQKDVVKGNLEFGTLVSDFRHQLGPFAGVGLVFLTGLVGWFAVGRDKVKVGAASALPPRGLSPAALHFIEERGFYQLGWPVYTATLVALCIKGLLRLDQDNGMVTVVREDQDAGDGLDAEERVVLETFGRGEALEINRENGGRFARGKYALCNLVEAENGKKWFSYNLKMVALLGGLLVGVFAVLLWTEAMETAEILLPILILGLPMIFGYAIFQFRRHLRKKIGMLLLLLILAGIVLILLGMFTQLAVNVGMVSIAVMVWIAAGFAVLMSAPTAEGRKLLGEIAGFRKYLESPPEEDARMDADGFESILPYAIALGLEEQWSGAFIGRLQSAQDPLAAHRVREISQRWRADLSGGLSGSILNSAMMAANPVSVRTSGSSGGSGGGAGGGGGGGW